MNTDLVHTASNILKLEKSLPNVSIPRRDDIFSISRFPHWETVMSNWFSYFLNADNGHGLTGLFSNAFANLLLKKGCEQNLDWLNDQIYSIPEVYTDKGNFIDLVVFDDRYKEREFEDALIIEHKIHADLYNDLEDYHNSIKTKGSKQGVVLSARPISFDTKDYININYLDLVKEVRSLAGRYTLDIDMNFVSYLKDFINNLERMGTERDFEAFKFCFDHGQTIEEVVAIKKKAEDELANSISQRLGDCCFNYYRKNPSSISLRAEKDQIVMYLEFDKLFSSKKCKFGYWITGPLVSEWNMLPSHDSLDEKFGHRFDVREKKKGKEWVEILRGYLDFEHIENLHEQFEEVLVEAIEKDIRPINNFIMDEVKSYKAYLAHKANKEKE